MTERASRAEGELKDCKKKDLPDRFDASDPTNPVVAPPCDDPSVSTSAAMQEIRRLKESLESQRTRSRELEARLETAETFHAKRKLSMASANSEDDIPPRTEPIETCHEPVSGSSPPDSSFELDKKRLQD